MTCPYITVVRKTGLEYIIHSLARTLMLFLRKNTFSSSQFSTSGENCLPKA